MILFCFLSNSINSGPSVSSSKTNWYLVSAGRAAVLLHQKEKSFGGNKGSIAILKELSSIPEITLARRGQGSSRHGFVFASIKYTLKSIYQAWSQIHIFQMCLFFYMDLFYHRHF